MNAALRPTIPVIDMEVGAAKSYRGHTDQDFARSRVGLWNLLYRERLHAVKDAGVHGFGHVSYD